MDYTGHAPPLSGFTSSLLGTGSYAVDIPAGTFTGVPTVVVSGFGGVDFKVVKVASVSFTAGNVRILVSVSSTAGTGTPANGGFSFVAIGA